MSHTVMLLADPQIGMTAAFSAMPSDIRKRVEGLFRSSGMLPPEGCLRVPNKPVGFDVDLARVRRAVDAAVRLRPDAIVICGDLVNNIDQPEQASRLLREFERFPTESQLICLPGNHDLSETFHHPNADGLAEYRRHFGVDYQRFLVGETFCLAINSETLGDPEALPAESERQWQFIEDALASQEAITAARRAVFMHTPMRTGNRVLDNGSAVLPPPISDRLLKIFAAGGVSAVFAGHLHQNRQTVIDGIRFVVTGAIGMPVVGRSGFRLLRFDDQLTQHYVAVD
ncbi:MAG: metallophosphoesterase [Pseudomonadota bacterium]